MEILTVEWITGFAVGWFASVMSMIVSMVLIKLCDWEKHESCLSGCCKKREEEESAW